MERDKIYMDMLMAAIMEREHQNYVEIKDKDLIELLENSRADLDQLFYKRE